MIGLWRAETGSQRRRKMAKIQYIKSARASKAPRKCLRCGNEIQVGESYKKVDLKTGPYSSITRNWCKDHSPRASELTTNDRMSRLLGAQETLEDSLAAFQQGQLDLDALKSDFEMQADEAESVADEYEESIDNMPESLQYSAQADEMREKADAIREWAEELRNVDWPEEIDPDVCAECDEDRDAPCHDESNEEEYDHDFEEQEEANLDVSEAEAAIGALSI
jgi:hypothetical protein